MVQAGGGRASSEGRATASGAEGAARERLGARRPLKDMPESGWELPTRGWSRLSASQVAAHPLLGARCPILRPLAGGQSCCPWLGSRAGAQHQPPQQAQGPRGGGGSPTPSWGGHSTELNQDGWRGAPVVMCLKSRPSCPHWQPRFPQPSAPMPLSLPDPSAQIHRFP